MGAGYIFELSLLWFYNGTRYRTYLTPTLLRLFPIHRTIKTSCELTASHVNAFSWRTRSAIRVGELSHTPDLLPGSQEMPSKGGRMNTDILARGAPRPGYCRYQVFGADI